jgi:hypothetical protein
MYPNAILYNPWNNPWNDEFIKIKCDSLFEDSFDSFDFSVIKNILDDGLIIYESIFNHYIIENTERVVIYRPNSYESAMEYFYKNNKKWFYDANNNCIKIIQKYEAEASILKLIL